MNKKKISKVVVFCYLALIYLSLFLVVLLFLVAKMIPILKAMLRWFREKLRFLISFLLFKRQKSTEEQLYDRIQRGRQQVLEKIVHSEFASAAVLESIILDISVVTYNSSAHLERLLKSIRAQHVPTKNIHLIFTDNHSSDSTLEMLTQFKMDYSADFYAISILPQQENYGFGKAHNLAFRHRLGHFFLVTNPDIAFEKNAIEKIVLYALADDQSSVASWELRQEPYEHPKLYDPITYQTPWSSAACLLLNPVAFEVVQGFEEQIFLYGEDVDLSYRFWDNGWCVKYCPFSVVWHYTYDSAYHFKSAQFVGSLAANGLLRLRYGSCVQIIISTLHYLKLAFYDVRHNLNSSKSRLPLVYKAYSTYRRSAYYFMMTRKCSALTFPFNGFDYVIARHGAFYKKSYPSIESTDLVSIIMRTHGEHLFWLKESIASVFHQTYLNIELIVVEDGSDFAKTFVEDIASRSDRIVIRYFSLPKMGRSATGNYGLAQAKGKYMMFLDSDDYLFCDHIEVLINELSGNKLVDVAYSLAWSIPTAVNRKDGVVINYRELWHHLPKFHVQPFHLELLQKDNLLPIQAALFRRTVYEQCGGFDTTLEYLEDWNLWLRYAHYFTFKMLPKLTSAYRVPGDPILFEQRSSLLLQSKKIAFERYQLFVKNHSA